MRGMAHLQQMGDFDDDFTCSYSLNIKAFCFYSATLKVRFSYLVSIADDNCTKQERNDLICICAIAIDFVLYVYRSPRIVRKHNIISKSLNYRLVDCNIR